MRDILQVLKDEGLLEQAAEEIVKAREKRLRENGEAGWPEEKRRQKVESESRRLESKVRHNDLPRLLDATLHLVTAAPVPEGLFSALEFLEDHFFEDRNPYRPHEDDVLATLNRHDVAHAWLKKGSRIDSLRCFFVLDILATLFAEVRANLVEVAD